MKKPNEATFSTYLEDNTEGLFYAIPNEITPITVSEQILENFGFVETQYHPHRLIFNQNEDDEFNSGVDYDVLKDDEPDMEEIEKLYRSDDDDLDVIG